MANAVTDAAVYLLQQAPSTPERDALLARLAEQQTQENAGAPIEDGGTGDGGGTGG